MQIFKLRPYQKAAVSAVLAGHGEGKRRLLLHLPTGAGKTVIATFIIQALRERGLGRCLFVAHRREILDQTARTLERHLPRAVIEVEQGERSGSGRADVVVASVQSLSRRMSGYDPKAFDLVLCDECHRALSPSFEQVIGYFAGQANQNALVLGMTATPRRSDGRSVLDLFGEPVFEISRTELEDLGYLVPMKYFTVQSDLKLDRVKISGGDFQVGALSRIMDTPLHRALAAKAWMEQGTGKRTIAFCAGVEHAEHLAADFRALGIAAEKIDGKTRNRTELLGRFQSGEIQILTNYGVLTEGFDDPGVACILMARPTTSPLVYTQCIGRGLRTALGKSACTVIDVVDRSTHQLQYDAVQMAGLPTKWRCSGGNPFRQARSLRGIQVTSPEAFLRIRAADSLEEVQAILMSLPPNVVVAGLDGEPVLRYTPPESACSNPEAEAITKDLLRQAHARRARIAVDDHSVRVTFTQPEIDNERYAYLKWHLARATQRTIEYDLGTQQKKRTNPRAVLASMLPPHCRITVLETSSRGDGVVASIDGLVPAEAEALARDFREECGLEIELRGQMSLF